MVEYKYTVGGPQDPLQLVRRLAIHTYPHKLKKKIHSKNYLGGTCVLQDITRHLASWRRS